MPFQRMTAYHDPKGKEHLMDTTTLTDALIDTYKELNMKFRQQAGTNEAMSIVRRMRDDEVMFSKALKDRVTGIGTADNELGSPADAVDGADDSLAHVISQFGSARATTLNLLRSIQDNSTWQDTLDDGSTILERVEQLVRSDAAQLQRLAQHTGS
jgi:hypothetical protein